MEPVSTRQHRAAMAGGVPPPEQIDDRLWSLALPIPGESLAYVLAAVHVDPSGAVAVVDPGWDSDEAWAALTGFLGVVGRSVTDVTAVVVTHAHPDHVGLAGRLRAESGAPVLLHEREQASILAGGYAPARGLAANLRRWGVPDDVAAGLLGRVGDPGPPQPPLRADVLLRDGDPLPVAGTHWRVLHTPGHTPGHICVVDEERRLLLSGDHVLPTQFPGIGLGGEVAGDPVVEYLHSLRRLAPFDGYAVTPGHGYRFTGLRGRRLEAIDHTLRRIREVADLVGAEPAASTWRIASGLTWSLGWPELFRSTRLYPALRQVDMYRDLVLRYGPGQA